MIAMEFVPNVWIKIGTFSLDVITSASEASDFLDEWPLERRGAFYYLAKIALEATVTGQTSVNEARVAFCTFCQDAGILAESLD